MCLLGVQDNLGGGDLEMTQSAFSFMINLGGTELENKTQRHILVHNSAL